MSIRVEGCGDSGAKLAVVGEAPGAQEEAQGMPFVGPTGELLEKALNEAGSSIHEIWRTNVCKVRPPDNDLNRLHEIGYNVKDFYEELFREINFVNPNCILAVGDTAFRALTGNSGILKWRGSIVKTTTGHKCVGTIHPAALFSHGDTRLPWINLTYIKADIQRAVEQAAFRELRLPKRLLLIAKSSLDVIRYLERNVHEKRCVVDVESYKTFPLCIGMAHSSSEAISCPLFEESISLHERAYIWRILSDYFADPEIKLVAQNMKFDQKRCRQIGITWRNPWMDIAIGWHVLWSEMEKKLGFISSFITEEPYYKDEGKEYNPKKDKVERLFLYNAKDCAVEFECMEKILEDLREANLESFFFDKIMPLHNLYYEMEDVGLLQDQIIKNDLIKAYTNVQKDKKENLVKLIKDYGKIDSFRLSARSKKQDVIKEILISDFNCDSPKQVAAMLYGYLHCPVRKDTSESTLKALANNAVKDSTRKEIIKGILEDRKIGKTIGTYLEAKYDSYPISDYGPFVGTSRIKTQFNINGTSSGRTSTGICKPPVSIRKEGIAIQTMTKHGDDTLDAGGANLRSMFIADPGWSFLEADGGQAEDRVVCVICEDWNALAILNKKDFIYNEHGIKDDRHTTTAMDVCGKSFYEINDYDRQIGKRTRHAGNYDMGKHQAMITFAKYGLFISEWKCGKLLEAFHAANPRIRKVFHASIQDALYSNNKTLISPHGRREIFFEQWGDELFKKAYSFIPQATVTDAVKFAMVRINRRVDRRWFHFAAESHDSCLPLVKDEYIAEAAIIVKEEMEQPISFRNCTIARDYDLIIPCEIKVGKRWIEEKKFKDGMVKYIV